MEEDKIQLARRDQDEQATAQRAAILGITYLDTRPIEDTLPLATGVLDIAVMHQNRLLPLMSGSETQTWQFGVTTQTPQSYIMELAKQYNDVGKNIQFFLISANGYKKLMDRFDPVIKVVHDDI